MKILAIDTSSQVASVALTDGEKLVCEYTLNHHKTHSQKLMPMIEEVFCSAQLKVGDIDYIATTVGPGSFTGLRIGIATAKALAHGTGKPLIGVSTLEAMAYNLPYCERLVCPIMDARRGQVYTAAYRMDNGEAKPVIEPCAMAIEELAQGLVGQERGVVFLGDGVEVHREYLEQQIQGCSFAPVNARLQRAGSVAVAAELMAKNGQVGSYLTVLPQYLRKPQAQREYEEKYEGK